MSYLAYILASLLAFVYASIAWKLYPHFISIKDRVVKSNAQLYWGRFSASWLVFIAVIVLIPLNWSSFDQIFRHDKVTSGKPMNPPRTEQISNNNSAQPVEQAVAPSISQKLEENPSSAISQPASTANNSQQPRDFGSGVMIQASSRTFSPSFDCAKAATGSERLICSNEQLSALDVQMMQVYRTAMHNAQNKDSLRTAQNHWRKNFRDACSTVDCMISEYRTRLESLEATTR